MMRNYNESTDKDPFNGLRFAGCLGLLGVVVFLVGVGLHTAVTLYAGVLP